MQSDPTTVVGFTPMGDEDLAEALRAANDAVTAHNVERRALLDHLQSLIDESGRRKDARRAERYEQARRRAAERGDAPPEPPVPSAATPRDASPRAAALRMKDLRIALPGRSADDDPAGAAPVRTGRARIASIDGKPPAVTEVSDHAVVRYLERVMGIDVESVRRRIMTPRIEAAIKAGVTRIRTAEGVVVSRQGVITTWLPNDAGPTKGVGSRIRDHGRSGRPAVGEVLRCMQDDQDD
jgi:hypothetical protein